MAKTIQTLRQQLTDISRDLDIKLFADETLNEHDKKNLAYAAAKVDAARQALFDCEYVILGYDRQVTAKQSQS